MESEELSKISFTGNRLLACGAALLLACAGGTSALAQAGETVVQENVTYADLADLADAATLVVKAKIVRQAQVEPERAPGLKPGFARLYVEAETQALLSGTNAIGQSLRYLVDLPLDERGRAPKLKKRDFILFAMSVPGRPGEIQLTDPGAQIEYSPQLEARLRPILSGLLAPAAPPRVTGVRDALSVAGNLAGESETQVFLTTEGNRPISISVIRRPGMVPIWGVTTSEVVDQAARPPERDTIAWYRLACFLPRSLPREANLASDAASQQRALADYALVMERLGPCPRNRS